MQWRRPRRRWLGAAGAALLAVVTLSAALTWGSIFDTLMASQMALTPTSLSYRKWVAPTIPMYMDVYMFNWTNAEKFPEEKPSFEQLGPYRFREYRRHVNVTFHPNNGSIAYRTMRSWDFEKSSSNGSLQDNITTLNVIAASALFRSRYWGYLQQKGLSMGLAMFGQRVSISKLAGEMLFEGYEDPLLDLAKTLPSSATGGAPVVDRFGWFYGRNNSIDTDGYVEVTSGSESGTVPGQILKWNHQDYLPYYKGECSKLAGSAGEFIARDLTEGTALTMFIPDLCRTVNLEYVNSGDMDGLQYYKYALLDRSFDNSTSSPSNTCFCNGLCSWGGVMNVSACRFGSPSFLSLPHFLHADPELRDNVEGMNPDPDVHSFYFAVEPKLGVPIDVAARFQYNVYVEPNPNVALYENMPRMLFPMFWVEQKVKVSHEVVEELKSARAILEWGGIACACAALVFTTLFLMAVCYPHNPKYTKPLDLIPTCEKPKDESELKHNLI